MASLTDTTYFQQVPSMLQSCVRQQNKMRKPFQSNDHDSCTIIIIIIIIINTMPVCMINTFTNTIGRKKAMRRLTLPMHCLRKVHTLKMPREYIWPGNLNLSVTQHRNIPWMSAKDISCYRFSTAISPTDTNITWPCNKYTLSWLCLQSTPIFSYQMSALHISRYPYICELWYTHTMNSTHTHHTYNKLARTGLAIDFYLLPTSKSHDTKTRTKIKNSVPISFRYCALI